MKYNSLAVIQTDNLVTAISVADEIIKSGDIDFIKKEGRPDGGIILYFNGDAPQLENGLKAGIIVAHQIGKIIASSIIKNPSDILLDMIFEEEKRKLKRKTKVTKRKSEEKLQTLFDTVEEEIAEEKFKVDKHVEKKIEIMTSTYDDEIIAAGENEGTEDFSEKGSVVAEQEENENNNLEIKAEQVKEEENKQTEVAAEIKVEKDAPKNGSEQEEKFSGLSHLERLRAEAKSEIDDEIKNKKDFYQETEEDRKEKPDKKDVSVVKQNSELQQMNVHQLRKLARSMNNFPIKGREISKANRNTLLEYFNSL
jgi:microcompartment protein CcmL/EutN